MRYQLRSYTVREGEMDAFVREWKQHVVPLRRRHGFEVVGAWVIEEEGTPTTPPPSGSPAGRFVWILGYGGLDGFEVRDAAYYASPERASLDPDPARHLEHVELAFMTAVEV